MIYDNLNQIADRFDLFLFDAYGVFWEGNGFYPHSLETMQNLRRQSKTVVIISNTTQLHDQAVAGYTKRGLIGNRDYDFFISSGDLMRQTLIEHKLQFRTCRNPKRYFVIGKPHSFAFNNTSYEQVLSLKDADFVYCGVPLMGVKDVSEYPQFTDRYIPTQADENGHFITWDTLTAVPFEKIVNQATALKLPVLNANPDFTAKEGHPLVPERPAEFVVRNGTLAEMFRQRGADVLEFGKPHRNIYDFVFAKLQEQGITINKAKTCMIGDTVRTDIKGGFNAGVTPILCVETGVTAEEISKGSTVENLCLNENIDVKQVIQIKSVGGKK